MLYPYQSYLYIHIKDPIATRKIIVDETFFKEYFFPIDKRIINVFFYERETILNIDILNRELYDELLSKEYEVVGW
jgi:hypothetical protein